MDNHRLQKPLTIHQDIKKNIPKPFIINLKTISMPPILAQEKRYHFWEYFNKLNFRTHSQQESFAHGNWEIAYHSTSLSSGVKIIQQGGLMIGPNKTANTAGIYCEGFTRLGCSIAYGPHTVVKHSTPFLSMCVFELAIFLKTRENPKSGDDSAKTKENLRSDEYS